MKEKLGAWLRQTREAQGHTLKDAEDATHIRPYFLQALEAGDFAAFPGGKVQVRGFLRIYARYLELPPNEVLALYDAEACAVAHPATLAQPSPRAEKPRSTTQKSSSLSPPSTPLSAPRSSWLRKLFPIGIILVIILIIAVWYFVNRGQQASIPPTATAPATTPAVAGEVPVTTTTSLTPPAVTARPAALEENVTLTLTATEHVWVSVTVDDEETFTGMMSPDQTLSRSGQLITVRTGNGAGLLITVNDQPQGAMGGRGQICIRSWGPTGEVTEP